MNHNPNIVVGVQQYHSSLMWLNNQALILMWSSGEGRMLILTRRVGETLKIGDEVEVSILGVRGNQVRVGVEAPKNVAVHREEIYKRIQDEKKRQC